MPRRKRNRSQDIRDYLGADPAAGPTKIVAELKKKGIDVSAALASRVRSQLQNPQGTPKRSGPGRPRSLQAGRRIAGELVAIDSLIEARAFVNKVGGIDEATRALKALAQIG